MLVFEEKNYLQSFVGYLPTAAHRDATKALYCFETDRKTPLATADIFNWSKRFKISIIFPYFFPIFLDIGTADDAAQN